MKGFGGRIILCLAGLLSASNALAENSIGQLPQLGALLVKSYECRTGLTLAEPAIAKESLFSFRPLIGPGTRTENTLREQDHEITATANAQSLQLLWKRSGKVVASAQSMIQKSSTKALVLLVQDPLNPENQVTLDCGAVTFEASRKGGAR